MADLKVRFPWPVVSDPTQTALLTLVDNEDGTYSPKISATGLTPGDISAAPSTVTYWVKTASSGLSAEIALGSGNAGQIVQSDGTNPAWVNKPIAANVASDGTTAQVIAALIAGGLMASA